MVADVSCRDIGGRLCGSKAGESRVVGDGDRSAAISTTPSTSTPSSELSTATSEFTALAATSSSTTEAALTIASEATLTVATEASFAVSSEAIATSTAAASSELATFTATFTAASTSAASAATTSSTLWFLESVVDVEALLRLSLTLTLSLGFFSLEEGPLLLFLERLGFGPLLVLFLTLVWSTGFLGTEAQVSHSLRFLLCEIVVIGLMVIFLFWFRLVEAITSHAFGSHWSVLERWVLCSSIPVARTFSSGSPPACFLRLCHRLTGSLVSEFSLTGIRAPRCIGLLLVFAATR